MVGQDGRVTGIDMTAAMLAKARAAAAEMGADNVEFVEAEAEQLPFADASFDAAWIQHASMNIEAKEDLVREIRRILRPRGRLALHEIFAGAAQPIHFPVPWAGDPSLSFLEEQHVMRDLFRRVGFRELEWRDVSAAALAWGRARTQAILEPGRRPLGIHLLLGREAPTIAQTMVRNFEEGRLSAAYGVFERG
jgi:SAM-dependent methyltransferase